MRFRNTWGDAIHVVFSDVESAADFSLTLQAQLAQMDRERLMLPLDLGLRVALDMGPVFEGKDYVRDETFYFGSSLTRAARMEPVTAVGEVYVTEAFAAIAALECRDRYRCEYVGTVPMAKDFGKARMYLLQRR